MADDVVCSPHLHLLLSSSICSPMFCSVLEIPQNHIHKAPFNTPFVCGAKNLGEALRRIGEGAAFIRCKGEAGSGNVIE